MLPDWGMREDRGRRFCSRVFSSSVVRVRVFSSSVVCVRVFSSSVVCIRVFVVLQFVLGYLVVL